MNTEGAGWASLISLMCQACSELERTKRFPALERVSVGGSIGRGDAKPNSDVDVFIRLKGNQAPEAGTEVVRWFISWIGRPAVFRGPTKVPEFGWSHTAIWSNGQIVQWNVLNDDDMLSTMSNAPKIQLLARRRRSLGKVRQLPIPFRELAADAVSLFWLRAMNLVQCLERGEIWSAMTKLSEMRLQIMQLERCNRRTVPPGNQMRKPAKALEAQLGARFARILASTLAEYDRRSVARGAIHSLRIMRSGERIACLRSDLLEQGGYEAREGLAKTVRRRLRKLA